MGNCGISRYSKNQYALNTITNSLPNEDLQPISVNYTHKMENSMTEIKIPSEKKIRLSTSQLVLTKFQKIEDDYVFVSVLGKGAYGCVKKARHRVLNVLRAIKCIAKKKMNADENSKLINEVEILKNLVNLL